ncbi:hypothetical protein E4K72_12615 [Oxalobacteraceae bacterium OM1]|nr:hypothetical protein E4K72_12615 [Oxalobacteraceae bacterium OM1]
MKRQPSTAIPPIPSSAPGTTREALERILAYGERHAFACDAYADGRRRDPIGLFFSSAHLAFLERHATPGGSLMQSGIGFVSFHLGIGHVEALTAMRVEQAGAIQSYYDECGQRRLLDAVRAVLAGTSTVIGVCDDFTDLDMAQCCVGEECA